MHWKVNTAGPGIEISNLFASFLESVYIKDFHQYLQLDINVPTSNHIIKELEVSTNNVHKLLCLNTKEGAVPDGLPNILQKNCATSLSEHITHIYSTSLHDEIFPTDWKFSYVYPFHKDGPRLDVTNYRPICIQTALVKLFEKMVLLQLTTLFTNTISSNQHGFIGGRSTTSNLFIYVNYLLEALNNGQAVHTIYTDFSKAFDRVDHNILLDKLSNYGIQGRALSWIHSYLIGRQLQVNVHGHLSIKYEVSSGVPQGSHLGRILFNIFVNDIGANFKTEYLLYADDLKIFRVITSVQDTQTLQCDVDILSAWYHKNKRTECQQVRKG